jgi:hypothetical protein
MIVHLRFAICDLRLNSIANRKLQIANALGRRARRETAGGILAFSM